MLPFETSLLVSFSMVTSVFYELIVFAKNIKTFLRLFISRSSASLICFVMHKKQILPLDVPIKNYLIYNFPFYFLMPVYAVHTFF